jgi:hypothetical protein
MGCFQNNVIPTKSNDRFAIIRRVEGPAFRLPRSQAKAKAGSSTAKIVRQADDLLRSE